MHTLALLRKRFASSGYADVGLFFEREVGSEGKTLRCLVPIAARDEAFLALPPTIARQTPHPYEALGAPYGTQRPYCLRKSVVTRLVRAQQALETQHPGYRLHVFDAYRPLAVQEFMIEHETRKLARNRFRVWGQLTSADREGLRSEVRCFWAVPDPDPTRPPPHSTGGALDLTVIDPRGHPLPMGTPIDHVGPESTAYHFAEAPDREGKTFHANRQLLNRVMSQAGFHRLPHEWWHFSHGDQWWALLAYLEGNSDTPQAWYGRYP